MHSGRSSRSSERKHIMILLAFLVSMAVAGIVWAAAILIGAAMDARILKLLDRTGYYEGQAEYLETQIDKVSEAAELPDGLANGCFLTDEILEVTKAYTTGRIKGFNEELNKHAVGERIRANLYAYLEAEGMSKSVIQTDALPTYIARVEDVYEQAVDHSFVRSYHAWKTRLSLICIIVIAFLTVFSVLCLFLIYRVCKMRHKTLSYLNRALEGAAMIAGVPAAAALTMKWCQRVEVSAEYLRPLEENLVNGIFIGVLTGCVVILLLIIVNGIIINNLHHHK